MPIPESIKKFIGPSLVIGPITTAGANALLSKNNDKSVKQNLTKGLGVGLVADAATGVGMAGWDKFGPKITSLFKAAFYVQHMSRPDGNKRKYTWAAAPTEKEFKEVIKHLVESGYMPEKDMEKLSHIVERSDGWHLMSSDGSKHLGGPYPSRGGALKRERQVEYFKHKHAEYSDLPVGREIEHEHEPTLERLKSYLSKNKTLPNIDWLANSIAHDHLKEFNNYYCDNEGLPKLERKLQKEKDKTANEELYYLMKQPAFKEIIKKDVKAEIKKLAKDMPSFENQNRPAKVKEIYHALKRDHPSYSARKKARIANYVYDKMKA